MSFDVIDTTEAAIDVEDGNRVIIIESDVVSGSKAGNQDDLLKVGKTRELLSDRAAEVRSLFFGYHHLRKNFEKFNEAELMNSVTIDETVRSPLGSPRPVAVSLLDSHFLNIITDSVRGILALRRAKLAHQDSTRVEVTALPFKFDNPHLQWSGT